MDTLDLNRLLNELRSQAAETEWLEFKKNNIESDEIGEYISALSNSACLHDKVAAYLIFGIADKTHEIVGTSFQPNCLRLENENLRLVSKAA